ncbi:hypothetical protein [Paenibacillus sp.]|uniref:hypothetical protein n=1 Tax=Paenibacillus sp. TaxID=58172 RepID=UPI0028124414|nr:hypothetical protein [Paenibacillus sp.]
MFPTGNERGGMTLFALVTLSALFIVAIVLADVVRARMTAMDAEGDARRAGRTLLASFEPSLLKYGLFGASESESRTKSAEAVVAETSREQSKGSAFRFYDASDGFRRNFAIEPLYHLGDHRVFRRQILERMKYIAPIEFGIEVTEKLFKAKPQIAAAKQYAELSQQLQAIVNKREAALDRAWTTAQSLAGAAGGAGGSLQSLMNRLHESLEEAENANRDVSKQLNAPAPRAPNGPETMFPHVTVYPPDFFVTYRVGAGTVASMHEALAAASAEAAAVPKEQAGAAFERVERFREDLRRYVSEWLGARRAFETKRAQEGNEIRRLEANQRQAAETQLNRRRDNWKDLCTVETTADYLTLIGPDGLFEKYRAYNEHSAAGGIEPELDAKDAESFLTSAVRFTNAIGELTGELLDETFANEYAIMHFTYRTDDKPKYPVKIGTNIGDRASHRLRGQEAEFILYGLPSCHMNLTAMHTELFVLRTGLRTMEELLKPETGAKAATPWLALLTALAQGAKAANDDVDVLLSGEAVELPFVPGATMDYRDHLRLFYLLHSRDESTLSRMQALIELNTGIDLMRRYTAVRVRTESAPSLSVIPAARKETEVVVSY